MAICSNVDILRKNITKEKRKLKRLQKQASRQYDLLIKKKIDTKSNRLLKLEKKILKQHQRISNILNNNIHHISQT